MRFRTHLQCTALVAITAALLFATPSHAQESEPAAEDTGVIVVTAQKRKQNLQDVATSVSALGGASLQALGRQDATALAGQLPSLQVNTYSPTTVVFNIRGVSQNDFADSQEAPIAFYNDEVYVSSLGSISGQTFDLERVEILRGPQGTLFGRNATGGLVQVVTAKPTDQLDGFGTITVGSYGQFATEAAIGGPLTDWLRARISGTTNHHGGYIENRIGPDIGNSKFYGFRVQLAADVSSQGTLTLKGQFLRNDNERSGGLYSFIAARPDADGLGVPIGQDEDFYGTGPGADPFGYAEPDNNPFTGSFDRIGAFERTYYSFTGRYEHRFEGATLTSITDYQDLRKTYGEDTDMSPNPIFNYDVGQKLYQVSQEVRLNGKTGALTWLAGVYGMHITSNNDYQITSPADILPRQDYGGRLTTDNWAVFGQVEYAIVPELSATLGGRYSSDLKKLDFTHSTAGVLDFTFNPGVTPLARQRFNDWSGKVSLEYRPTSDILAYAGVSRGTKSGGFGTQAFTPIDPATLPFRSEILTNYEAGLKLTLFDRTTTLNLAGFHYDYKDYQAFVFIGLSQFIVNRPARVNGFEAEFNTRPIDGLNIRLFGTYLDTKVKDITLPFGRVTDRVLPQAPEFSGGALLRYEFDAGPGKLALQTDWKYNSSQFFSTVNAPIDREGSYAVGNARLSYALDGGRWEAAVFANNITNRRYRVYDLDLSLGLGDANQSFARPRWIGGSVTYRIK